MSLREAVAASTGTAFGLDSPALPACEAALAVSAESDHSADVEMPPAAATNGSDDDPHASEHGPTIAAIDQLVRATDRFLVTSHARPDGDAVGSVLGFAAILRQLGKQFDLVLADPVPQAYHRLPGVDSIRHAAEIDPAHYELAVILECDGTERTGLRGLAGLPILNIDHHLTGRSYGDTNWIDVHADAVAALVYRLARHMRLEITPCMATCLYAALLTDTGAFTYPGTSAETFSLAHELIQLGARADGVARDVLYSVPPARIHLLGAALSRVVIQGGIAWSYVAQADLQRFQATDDDSEGTVNYLISVAGVEAAAFLRELPGQPQRFRVSLRSKSSLDVSKVAQACGGGGHRNAAGCTLAGPLEAAVDRLLGELGRALHLQEADAATAQ